MSNRYSTYMTQASAPAAAGAGAAWQYRGAEFLPVLPVPVIFDGVNCTGNCTTTVRVGCGAATSYDIIQTLKLRHVTT